MEPLTITVAGVCRLLSIGRTTAYELMRDGKLETLKIGRRRLITYRSAQALIEGAVEAAVAGSRL